MIRLALLALLLTACSNSGPVQKPTDHLWPDGTYLVTYGEHSFPLSVEGAKLYVGRTDLHARWKELSLEGRYRWAYGGSRDTERGVMEVYLLEPGRVFVRLYGVGVVMRAEPVKGNG